MARPEVRKEAFAREKRSTVMNLYTSGGTEGENSRTGEIKRGSLLNQKFSSSLESFGPVDPYIAEKVEEFMQLRCGSGRDKVKPSDRFLVSKKFGSGSDWWRT